MTSNIDTVNEFLKTAHHQKQNGEIEKAIHSTQKSICHNLECAHSYELLGDLYITQNDYIKAKKALIQALKIDNESENAHYLMGFLLSVEESWEESLLYLQKANKKIPNTPEIVRCLGWSFFQSGKKNQGIALLERASKINPEDINILCDLGVCYMGNNEFIRAEKILKKVIQIDKESKQAQECFEILNVLKTQE